MDIFQKCYVEQKPEDKRGYYTIWCHLQEALEEEKLINEKAEWEVLDSARGGSKEEEWLAKEYEGAFWIMKDILCLDWMMTAWVCIFVKTYQTVRSDSLRFIVYKLYCKRKRKKRYLVYGLGKPGKWWCHLLRWETQDEQFEKKALLSVWGACAISKRRCSIWVEYKELKLRRQILAGDKNVAIISTQMVINIMKVSEIILEDCENEREQSLEQNPEEHQYLRD